MRSTSSDIDLSTADPVKLTRPPKGLWRETLERLIRKPSAVVGLIMLGTLVIIAIFAPVIATHNPLTVLLDVPEEGVYKREKPCIHLLGCPEAGDTLVKIDAGAQVNAAQLNSANSLIAGATGNTIEVWNTSHGNETMVFDQEQPVVALDWSPNDQQILSASGEDLYIWDVNRRALNRTLTHDGGANNVAWNADGTRFFSADAHHVRIWDTLSWNQVGVIDLEDPLVAVQWNSNGTVIMTASGSKVQLWNAFTATEVASLEHDAPLTSARFNKASSRILTTSGSILRVWNASTYDEQLVIEHDGNLAHGAWLEAISRGIENVMASDGNQAMIWDVKTGELLLNVAARRTD